MDGKYKWNSCGGKVLRWLRGRYGIPCRESFEAGSREPDIDAIISGAVFHGKVNSTEDYKLYCDLDQAEHEAHGSTAIVIHKKDQIPWAVTLKMDDLVWLLKRPQEELDFICQNCEDCEDCDYYEEEADPFYEDEPAPFL